MDVSNDLCISEKNCTLAQCSVLEETKRELWGKSYPERGQVSFDNKMKQKLIQEKTLNIKIEYIKQSIYVKYIQYNECIIYYLLKYY